MKIRNRIFSLALVPVLTLFIAVALAAKPGYEPTGLGVEPLNKPLRGTCAVGEELVDQFPNLTNGPEGGSAQQIYSIYSEAEGQNVDVIVSLTYYGEGDEDENGYSLDNSFDFTITNGFAEKFFVKTGEAELLYDYGLGGTSGDKRLNFQRRGSQDVSHLEFCLGASPPDTQDPVVTIRVAPSSDGITVSGIVDIIATIKDASLPEPTDLTITIVSDDGTDYTPVFPAPTPSDCDPYADDCREYTYSWDTTTVPTGTYIITITAQDTSASTNVGTGELIVTVSIENCLEGDDGPGGTDLGCNPTGYMFNELPDDLRGTNLLQGQTLTQAAVPALPTAQDNVCGDLDGSDGGPYPFIGRDPRWVETFPDSGEYVYNAAPLDLSDVFDLEAVVPQELWPVEGLAVMRSDTRGEPCLALLFGDASFNFAYFYDPQFFPNLEGTQRYTYTLTQLPDKPELGLPNPNGIGKLGDSQRDLQKVPEATYQPTDRFIQPFIGNQLGPFTSQVINPNRVKTPDFSFYALGTVQICESLLGSGLSPSDGLLYRQAVLDCSTDLAVTYFDDLDTLLAYVGEPDPTFPAHPPEFPDNRCLKDPSDENLRVELNKARSMIKVGNWSKGLKRLRALKLDAEQATWFVDERNCPGHVLMRLENLVWRTEQLELAESLL